MGATDGGCLPGETTRVMVRRRPTVLTYSGVEPAVFDFDGAVLNALATAGRQKHRDFFGYVRYHLSDHRPLWAEFKMLALHAPATSP
jgi:hypothetical protein